MEFLNPSLLVWSGLVGIPVVIHLLFRPRPKVQPFPPVMLLQTVKRRSQAILKIKHVLLLIARMAVLLLIVLAIARPRFKSTLTVTGGRETGAVAIVIDDSYRMQYSEQGATRFDRAKALACATLDTLEAGTQVTVVFASQEPMEFAIDVNGIKRFVQSTSCTNLGVTSIEAVAKAVLKLDELKGVPRELYVFTDMTRAAWTTAGSASSPGEGGATAANPGATLPASARGTTVYIVDVGTGGNGNIAVDSLAISPSVLRQNQPVRISGTVTGGDSGGARVVELFVEGEKRDEQTLALGIGERQSYSFSFTPTGEPLKTGYARLAGQDALALDDTRFFTLNLERPPGILLVNGAPSGDPDHDELRYLATALAPETLGRKQVVAVESITPQQLLGQSLQDYKAVILANVHGLSGHAWGKLYRFVTSGGGLIIFGGDKVGGTAYEAASGADLLLPAPLGKVVSAPSGAHMSPAQQAHPIVKAFQGGMNGDLSQATFSRFHELVLAKPGGPPGLPEKKDGQPEDEPVTENEAAGAAADACSAGPNSIVIMAFDGRQPALVQRNVGAGRVLFFASTCDADWSDFPRFPAYVPFVHEMVKCVCNFTALRHSYAVGESVRVDVEPGAVDARLAVFGPTGEPLASPAVDPAMRSAFVKDTFAPGNYEARYTAEARQKRVGWSVNIECSESGTANASPAFVEKQLPQMTVLLARDKAELEEHVRTVHLGKEYAMYALAALVALMLFELVFANRVF
ncbi:MAG: BatA domain-containing protein [Planctomycetota bacterium]|nr:BatA domain-containing protein [Planctomycetota bacterium]